MEAFSALLAICAGNSPVTGEFPAQSPVTRSFDVFFDLRVNKRLISQPWGWWFETTSRPSWRQRNGQPCLRWLCWVLSFWHLPVRRRPRRCSYVGVLFRCFIFCVLGKIQSFYPFKLRYQTEDIYVCIWLYVYVIYHTPLTRFYFVHKSHYHFYWVHNNVLQHVLCICCYYVLLYFVRNNENKDAQSLIWTNDDLPGTPFTNMD